MYDSNLTLDVTHLDIGPVWVKGVFGVALKKAPVLLLK